MEEKNKWCYQHMEHAYREDRETYGLNGGKKSTNKQITDNE